MSLTRYQALLLTLVGVSLFACGFSIGKRVYDHVGCHPTPPPAMTRLDCGIEEGSQVSRFTCTNKSVNAFLDCAEQMETWIETTYEGCK